MNGSRRIDDTVGTRVVDILRQRIVAGELAGGDRLRQLDLSEELGVSTTPVREAFRSLAAEGLLRIDTHRGAVVRRMTPAELLEIHELNLLVETDNLAYALPRMTPEALARAQRAQDRMRADPRGAGWAALHRDFHLALALPAGRPRVQRLLTDLLNLTAVRTRGGPVPARREPVLAGHDAMLTAARAGALEAVRSALHAHARPVLDDLRTD